MAGPGLPTGFTFGPSGSELWSQKALWSAEEPPNKVQPMKEWSRTSRTRSLIYPRPGLGQVTGPGLVLTNTQHREDKMKLKKALHCVFISCTQKSNERRLLHFLSKLNISVSRNKQSRTKRGRGPSQCGSVISGPHPCCSSDFINILKIWRLHKSMASIVMSSMMNCTPHALWFCNMEFLAHNESAYRGNMWYEIITLRWEGCA